MKGIKRCRSWERSYALDTHPTRMSTHVMPHPVTPRTHRHYAHRRTPTPDVTNVYLRYPMRPTHVTIVCLQRIPTTYPCNMAYTHCRCDQRISATYVHNISLRHISTTYPQYISPQYIPHTYPYNISPILTTPHPPMDISGNLW